MRSVQQSQIVAGDLHFVNRKPGVVDGAKPRHRRAVQVPGRVPWSSLTAADAAGCRTAGAPLRVEYLNRYGFPGQIEMFQALLLASQAQVLRRIKRP